ncbi:hypothetical protein SLS62_010638 [Diatrype stigma]|uniref:Uncharacterized protein n=1 Tax=Diatrype stigma TaxID=117547 RepID=A0AAN9U871_9PEZI
MSSNSRSYVTSSISFSSSSSSRNGETTGSRYAEHTTSDPLGTTTFTASQRPGEPVYAERRDYDASGRPIAQDRSLGQGTGGGGSSRRIEDVSDGQRENDRLYRERIEDEYAKREGGA